MKYYLIAPLKLNIPPLEYESREIFHKNDIVKIAVKNKSLLGIVLSEVEKPNFKCKEAVRSEFALSESQVILGHFVAQYYCVNIGVAFGIFTLGNLKNSSLGMQFRTCGNFGDFADSKSSLNPQNSHKYKSHTANTRIVDSNKSDSNDSSESSLRENERSKFSWQSIKNQSCVSTPNLARFVVQKIGSKGRSSASADFLLESELRGSPPKSEKRQLLARRGSGEGGAALLRKEKGESNSKKIVGDSQVAKMDSSRYCAQNDKSSVNCFGNESPSNDESNKFTPPKLSPAQQSALDFILSHDKTLLFGDTGSGKTEIYINAICATIAQGKNTLFLMPEIALTPQMERRLKSVFGDLVCIWHSKVSKAKKERILANLHSIKIIAGARSALFLPLENLGLIIIDEEHDEAYKSTTNPRYNSRDLAIFLAQKQGIRLILGSATPSLNSYHNFGKENRIFRLKGGYFEGKKSIVFDSDLENVPQSLLDKIATALKNQKQIIVFVPMRGNFKVLQCESCGSGVKCKHCSINMSLHSKKNALICHYCGYAEPFFDGKTKCKFCDSTAFKALKIGTQEVFKNLSAHFTNAKIAIFDRDEVRSDSRLRGILGDFNDGKIDILIGTQMISKGHDYHNVELVAILGIDNLLNSSDFRAYERAVALLFQIAGRCGRKNDGEVFINTQNRAFFTRFLNDYEDFLRFELENRANLYPPFMRLALICAQNKSESKAKDILQNAKKIVESTHRNIEIVGLNKAPIERIGGLWRYFMLVRAKSAKELLTALLPIKDMGLIIDIDPQSIF